MDFFTHKIKLNEEINIKIPWIEKYRPHQSDEILLEPFIKQKIDKILETKVIPNMIITGEPGTGKTSTILFIAKKLYSDVYENNVLELNASDDRGLSIINNTIIPFCKKKINNSDKYPNYKLIILDEADSITSKAQNLLSNIINLYNKNIRIVFICNDCSQIIESIQSRCIIIKYPRINNTNLYQKIKYICEQENILYDDNGINTLIFVSENDIRQTINNLECIYYSFGKLYENYIYKLIDKPKPYYVNEIIKNCINNNYVETINIIKKLYNNGYTPNDIILTFMKCLFENYIELDENTKLKIYEILSSCYIKINDGNDTLLQLCGCISKIFIYLNK
jgi:replication factor C subunit 2/4